LGERKGILSVKKLALTLLIIVYQLTLVSFHLEYGRRLAFQKHLREMKVVLQNEDFYCLNAVPVHLKDSYLLSQISLRASIIDVLVMSCFVCKTVMDDSCQVCYCYALHCNMVCFMSCVHFSQLSHTKPPSAAVTVLLETMHG